MVTPSAILLRLLRILQASRESLEDSLQRDYCEYFVKKACVDVMRVISADSDNLGCTVEVLSDCHLYIGGVVGGLAQDLLEELELQA